MTTKIHTAAKFNLKLFQKGGAYYSIKGEINPKWDLKKDHMGVIGQGFTYF